MTRPIAIARLLVDRRGSSATEFALVLPILLFFLFAIIDVGRLYYDVNRGEKATQIGARYAIVTDIIPDKIANADYVGAVVCADPANPGSYKTCQTGEFITKPDALGTLTCTSASCTCTGTCPANATMNTGAFTRLVDRMKLYDPWIRDTNVSVSFRGSGLGYAGDKTGMDVIPLVTVELTGLQFSPLAFLSLVKVNLPSARTTLSAESSAGTQAN